MCINKENVFTELILPKSKPFIEVTPYRPRGKIYFVNYTDQTLSQFNMLKIQEYYLLRVFNDINLLFECKQIFCHKIA